MSRIIDSDLEQQLREVDDESPDYAGLRRRIVLEAEKRRAGWIEGTTGGRGARRKWAVPAASGLLACSVAAGVIFWQSAPAHDPIDTEPVYGAAVGQTLETSAAVDGVKLKLDHAIRGHFEGDEAAGKQEDDKLTLQTSLSGLDPEDGDYAGFGSGRLIDLDTGETQALNGAVFDLRQDLRDSSVLEGSWAEEGKNRRLRFEMNDLYVIRRHTVPLAGELQAGRTYPVPSVEGTTVRLLDSAWNEEEGLLNLRYRLEGKEANAAASYPDSLQVEADTRLLVNTGSRTVESTSGTWKNNEFNRNYELYDMDAQEREALTLSYSYAEKVREIDGSWQVEFTLDGSKAGAKAVKLTPVNAAEVQDKTGWTVGEATVGAYGVYLPINRKPEERTAQEGRLLYYDKRTLIAGDFESTAVEHTGWPLQPFPEQGQEHEEALAYRPFSLDLQDLTAGSLSVRLQDAVVLRRAPDDFWTELAAPQPDEQQAQAKLPDGSRLTYRYLRQGADLKVVTSTPDSLHLLEGTVLKVNGEVRKPDADSSYNPYREQGDYRVDLYQNVPEGAGLELGLGLYGQVDPSLNTEIVLRR
ncbi:hypothetical protein [Saccharibacillus qingshengii]|uniref:hypothetical protein n=1 Tax=Saccharibacillus qingshengii TaxID=1763540 RepID=UPI0015540AD3|nr:hypothetical protein [Saccharibacillus qingshengii]